MALMVLLEVTLRVFGFSSFYPILGLNPGWRLKGLTRAPASDRKHAQLTRVIGGSLVEVPYSSPMKPPSFASNPRLSAELMEATSTAAAVTAPAATTEGAAGGWWSATAAAAAAASAASVAAAAAAAAAWHATRAGGRRVVHGAGSAARNAAPCCLPTRLYRVHVCPGTAMKAAWTATMMSASDMTPPLAATASALVPPPWSAAGGRARYWQPKNSAISPVPRSGKHGKGGGCQQGQYRVMVLAVGVLYGHPLGAQRALDATAATLRAAPLVLRNVVLCEMEVV